MTFGGPAQTFTYIYGDPESQHGTRAAGQSRGQFSGERFGARQRMLEQFRAETPARWMGFLRAHFSCPMEVSMFFEVNEKTGRNWWNGVGRPTMDKALFAQAAHPDGYQVFMLPEIKRRAWA